jgi:hypothetical protein
MDDDLMSLRSNVSSSDNDDDLLGGFGSADEPSDWTSAAGSSDLDFGSSGEQPAWLRDLEVEPETMEPAPAQRAPEDKKKKKSARRPRKPGGKFLGLTPQQRTILALFLFLEVAVVSVLVLFFIGAINIP